MFSSSLANWDGRQSAQNQQPEQNDSGGIHGISVVDTSLKMASIGTQQHSTSYLDASLANREERRANWRDGDIIHQSLSSQNDSPSVISYISSVEVGLDSPLREYISCSNLQVKMDISRIFDDGSTTDEKEDDARTTYTKDAEGEEDDEDDAKTVDVMLEPPPSSPISLPSNGHNVHRGTSPTTKALSSPLRVYSGSHHPSPDLANQRPSPHHPVEESFESLFTPSPTPPPSRTPRERFLLSCVSVPHLPKGLYKSDYRPIRRKKRRPLPQVRVHQSLEEALQASMGHNADVGTLHTTGPKPRIPIQRNAVAGPSSASTSTHYVLASEAVKRKHRRSDADELYDSRQKKKIKATTDAKRLTTIKAFPPPIEEPVPGPPQKRDFAYTKYYSLKDRLRLHIRGIPNEPAGVLKMSVRYVRTVCHLDTAEAQEEEDRHEIQEEDSSAEPFWRRWSSSNSGSLEGIEDELSVGGDVEKWEAEDVDEDDVMEWRSKRSSKPHEERQTKSHRPSGSKVLRENYDIPIRRIRPAKPPKDGTSLAHSVGRRPDSPIIISDSESDDHPTHRVRNSHGERIVKDKPEHPKLSAKALGKQRAVSPRPDIQPSETTHSTSSSSTPPISLPHSPPPTRHSHAHEAIVTMHQFGPAHHHHTRPDSLTHPVHPPITAFRSHGADLFLAAPHDSPSKAFALETLEGGTHSHQHSILFTQESSVSTHLSGFHSTQELDHAMGNPSIEPFAMLDDIVGFGNGTIDPSLLGGSHLEEDDIVEPSQAHESPSPSHSHAHSSSAISHSQSPGVSPSSPHSASGSHSLAMPSGSNYSHSEGLSSPTSLWSLRPHKKKRRLPSGMVATADLNLSESSSDESDYPLAAVVQQGRSRGTTSKHPKHSSTTRKKAKMDSNQDGPFHHSKKLAHIGKLTGARDRSGAAWPRVEQKENCHQCRGTTDILKLICDCGKRYCVRCLSTRYKGELGYDPLDPDLDFTCPVCEHMCSCDICTKKRGGVYIPLRPKITQPAERSLKAIKITNNQRPRASLGGKTNLPPPAIKGPVTYWATIYGLDGEKVGNAFVGNDGNDEMVVARPLQTGNRKRIFAGDLQPSWGLGSTPFLNDLEPISWKDKSNGPNERIYVGNKAMLYKPVAPRRRRESIQIEVYDTRFSSPLSSLGSDDGVGEGEWRQWPSVDESDLGIVAQGGLDQLLISGPGAGFSADSLGDKDVMRAISLGLLACGVPVELAKC